MTESERPDVSEMGFDEFSEHLQRVETERRDRLRSVLDSLPSNDVPTVDVLRLTGGGSAE